MSAATGDGSHGYRPLVGPPHGWYVEWQVQVDSWDDMTATWGTYSQHWQSIIEQAWRMGLAGLDYTPGRWQSYRLDFGAMVQERTSCAEGWGSRRTIRRIFAPEGFTVDRVSTANSAKSAANAAPTGTCSAGVADASS